MPINYLAYGSNLHPVRLRERVDSASLIGVVVLPGFELTFAKRGQDGSGKCTLLESEDHHVHAALYRITRGHRVVLDEIEGLGKGYDLVSLTVDCDGRVVDCLTYVAMPTYMDRSLRPFTWYRDLVRRGAEHHSFPSHYVDAIRAVESVHDPDPERRRRHERLIRKMGDEVTP